VSAGKSGLLIEVIVRPLFHLGGQTDAEFPQKRPNPCAFSKREFVLAGIFQQHVWDTADFQRRPA
jgi:hypothetical protein